ncbi:hypothetical protein [Snodgrassella alvi]|uniref:hypothetical protein n=1 Tax=Snodgrassella alvi TaxID=1196083 RepID=UPI000C1E354A|nr:hypothetical protein [Snodgrassella alvi]PIT47050.1 hypothetical protein BHC51_07040 [Snodgrassella alvi]
MAEGAKHVVAAQPFLLVGKGGVGFYQIAVVIGVDVVQAAVGQSGVSVGVGISQGFNLLLLLGNVGIASAALVVAVADVDLLASWGGCTGLPLVTASSDVLLDGAGRGVEFVAGNDGLVVWIYFKISTVNIT